MRPRTSSGVHPCAVAVLTLVIAGCASPLDTATRPTIVTDEAAEPASRAGTGIETGAGAAFSRSGFYPLTLGNRWLHRNEFVVQIIPDVGDAPPPLSFESTTEREIICAERREWRTYLVERATERTSEGSAYHTWIRYRQDAKGLYEADVAISEPSLCERLARFPTARDRPATLTRAAPRPDELVPMASSAARAAFRVAWRRLRERMVSLDAVLRTSGPSTPGVAPGGPARPSELIRLRYPLHPGARWVIRSEPFMLAAEVESLDDLDLAPGRLRGWRIRLLGDFFGTDDVVRVWYGPSGYLQLLVHAETKATDQAGHVYGRLTVDQHETLEGLWLARKTFAAPPLSDSGSRR